MTNKTNMKIVDAIRKFNQMNEENIILYFFDDKSLEFAVHFRNYELFESSPFLFDMKKFVLPD